MLKYLVLANMLTGSEVNPFDSQETKPYKNDPQIKAMTDLVDAYQRREVHSAEKILRGLFRSICNFGVREDVDMSAPRQQDDHG